MVDSPRSILSIVCAAVPTRGTIAILLPPDRPLSSNNPRVGVSSRRFRGHLPFHSSSRTELGIATVSWRTAHRRPLPDYFDDNRHQCPVQAPIKRHRVIDQDLGHHDRVAVHVSNPKQQQPAQWLPTAAWTPSNVPLLVPVLEVPVANVQAIEIAASSSSRCRPCIGPELPIKDQFVGPTIPSFLAIRNTAVERRFAASQETPITVSLRRYRKSCRVYSRGIVRH